MSESPSESQVPLLPIGPMPDGFRIEERTIVQAVDLHAGKKIPPKLFKDWDLANVYAEQGSKGTMTPNLAAKKIVVITNGEFSYILGDGVEHADEEAIGDSMKSALTANMSPAAKKLLGL